MEVARERGDLLARAALAVWRYMETGDPMLEADLRAGMDVYPSTRASLSDLLIRTGRGREAEQILRGGVDRGEVESMLLLGNLLWERGDLPGAERLYRLGAELGDEHSKENLDLLLNDLPSPASDNRAN